MELPPSPNPTVPPPMVPVGGRPTIPPAAPPPSAPAASGADPKRMAALAGLGLLGAGGIGYGVYRAGSRVPEAEKQSSAFSPAVSSALRHGGIGAAVGGIAGAAGGAAAADPQHRGRGALKGALVGAGIGGVGGAGASALRSRLPHIAPNPAVPHAPPAGGNPLGTAKTVKVAPPVHTYGPSQGVSFPERTGAFNVQDPRELYHLEQKGWKLGPNDMLYPPDQVRMRTEAITSQVYKGPVKVSADLEERLNRLEAERAHEARADRIVHGLDALGLGILAAPAAGELVAGAGKRLQARGGRLGALGGLMHSGGEAVSHRLGQGTGKAVGEVVGLGLMVPHLVSPLAHRLTAAPKIAPAGGSQPLAPAVQEDPTAAADMRSMSAAAQKVGRLLASPGPREKVAISVGGAANWAWKNKKTLAGIGAVGTVGAGLYGAKKGIDATHHMATHQHEASRAVGVPAGMRPASSAYTPIGSS